MQLFDEALTFTGKYMDSEFSAKNSQHAIQLFRAYALSKTNKPKQAKDLVKNVITQNDVEQTKKFFERTLNSSKDSDFVTDIMKTLQTVGFKWIVDGFTDITKEKEKDFEKLKELAVVSIF